MPTQVVGMALLRTTMVVTWRHRGCSGFVLEQYSPSSSGWQLVAGSTASAATTWLCLYPRQCTHPLFATQLWRRQSGIACLRVTSSTRRHDRGPSRQRHSLVPSAPLPREGLG